MKTNPTLPEFKPCTSTCGYRTTMNGKPVLYRDAKTVLNDTNDAFREKLLCDGLIINLGDACAYSCSFCYVGSMQRYLAPPLLDALRDAGYAFVTLAKAAERARSAVA